MPTLRTTLDKPFTLTIIRGMLLKFEQKIPYSLVAYFPDRKRSKDDHHLIWFICSVLSDWARFPSRHFLHAS